MVIALSFIYLGVLIPSQFAGIEIISKGWNILWGSVIGYIFLRKTFIDQFRKFNYKVAIWGTLLTILAGIFGGSLYSLIGVATKNTIGNTLTIETILFSIPLLLMGEEILSTNILLALKGLGIDFKWASFICGFLFAIWHIPAYGFNPLQLIITLMPTRLALNYVWKKSESIWVSWICHYLFDCLAFIQFLV